jgi:hypothetical protein
VAKTPEGQERLLRLEETATQVIARYIEKNDVAEAAGRVPIADIPHVEPPPPRWEDMGQSGDLFDDQERGQDRADQQMEDNIENYDPDDDSYMDVGHIETTTTPDQGRPEIGRNKSTFFQTEVMGSGVSWDPPLTSCLAKPLQEGSETAATGSHSQDAKSQHRPGVEFLQILGEIKAQQQELNVVKKAEPQFDGKWERIKVTVDSGANAPVMPPHFGQLYPVQESPGSRNGDSYMAANGGIIPNLGQKMLPVVTKEGAVRGYLSQCADVTTGLQSVIHLNRCGHGVWFDGDDSFAVNKETGEMTQIDHDGKDFTMDMWVIPPEELHTLMVNEGFQRHHP